MCPTAKNTLPVCNIRQSSHIRNTIGFDGLVRAPPDNVPKHSNKHDFQELATILTPFVPFAMSIFRCFIVRFSLFHDMIHSSLCSTSSRDSARVTMY